MDTLWKIHVLSFGIPVFFFTLADLFGVAGKLKWHRKQIRWSRLLTRDLWMVLFNLSSVAFLGSGLLSSAIQWSNSEIYPEPVDLLKIPGLFLVEEVMFYYLHRLLHTKLAFKYIHKWHHEWDEPTAIIALSAHPVENIMSNVMPVALGIWLFHPSLVVSGLWVMAATVSAVLAHSGYAWAQSHVHDRHHKYFKFNYGVMGWLDWLHGTTASG